MGSPTSTSRGSNPQTGWRRGTRTRYGCPRWQWHTDTCRPNLPGAGAIDFQDFFSSIIPQLCCISNVNDFQSLCSIIELLNILNEGYFAPQLMKYKYFYLAWIWNCFSPAWLLPDRPHRWHRGRREKLHWGRQKRKIPPPPRYSHQRVPISGWGKSAAGKSAFSM